MEVGMSMVSVRECNIRSAETCSTTSIQAGNQMFNQAEQLAIVKALEAIETTDIPENSPLTINIFIDSRITLDLLQNANNHSYLIKEISIVFLNRANWTIGILWV
jgi:ribonuclease HI